MAIEDADDELVVHVGAMSRALTSLIENPNPEIRDESLSKRYFQGIVKAEILEALASTQASIVEVKDIILRHINGSKLSLLVP